MAIADTYTPDGLGGMLHTWTQYNDDGQVYRSYDARGNYTQTQYDELGQITRQTMPDGSYILMTYDSLGRMTSQTAPAREGDPAGPATNYEYDASGNLTKEILPAVTITLDGAAYTRRPTYEYTYNEWGDLTSQTDPMDQSLSQLPGAQSRVTTFVYDDYGNKTETLLPGESVGQGELTSYDRFGRIVYQIDGGRAVAGQGHVTYCTYNDTQGSGVAGKIASKLYFADQAAFQAYHANPTDPANTPDERVDYAYTNKDELRSVTQYARTVDGATGAVTLVQSHQTTYTYNVNGQVTSIADNPEGTIHYEYDPFTGAKVREYTDNNDTLYSYSSAGQLEKVYVAMLNGHRYAQYAGWDAANRVPTFSNGVPLVTSYTYTAAGQVATEIQPGGVVTRYDYDVMGRVLSERVDRGGTPISKYDYTYDVSGNRLTSAEKDYDSAGALAASRTFTWIYDAAHRLTAETLNAGSDGPGAGGYTDAYSYDLSQNRLSKTIDTNSDGTIDETITSTYDRLNRQTTEVSSVAGTTSFAYDDSGNLVDQTRTLNGTVVEHEHYRFDDRDKLVGADVNGDGTEEAIYAYDDFGNRVAVVTGNTKTVELVDPNNPTAIAHILEERSVLGTAITSYLLGLQVIGQETASGYASLIHDAHGSTRRLVDAMGMPLANTIFVYDAYGNAVGLNAATAATKILYAGGLFDVTSGKYDLNARYMDPQTGRFMSRDPYHAGPESPLDQNAYPYCAGNPANRVDPKGTTSFAEILEVMKNIAQMFREKYDELKPAVESTYKMLVPVFVWANYWAEWELTLENMGGAVWDAWDPMGAGGSGMGSLGGLAHWVPVGVKGEEFVFQAVALVQAFPYQLQLLAKFEKLKDAAQGEAAILMKRKIVDFFISMRNKAGDVRDATSGITVTYKWNGYPDFEKWLHPVGPSVFIGYTGYRDKDFRMARSRRMVLTAGLGLATSIFDRRFFLWHHHEVVGLLQYVRKITHPTGGGVWHRGGVNMYEILTGESYDYPEE